MEGLVNLTDDQKAQLKQMVDNLAALKQQLADLEQQLADLDATQLDDDVEALRKALKGR